MVPGWCTCILFIGKSMVCVKCDVSSSKLWLTNPKEYFLMTTAGPIPTVGCMTVNLLSYTGAGLHGSQLAVVYWGRAAWQSTCCRILRQGTTIFTYWSSTDSIIDSDVYYKSTYHDDVL